MNKIDNKIDKIVIRSLTFLVVLTTFATIAFADDYHWECMTHGDCLSGGYCCYHDQCLACVKDGYTRLFAYCYDKPMCKYGNSTIDQEAPEITVNLPIDGSVFSSRYVDFDIQIDEPVSLYYLDSADERHGYIRMCSNCVSYTRPRSFDDGSHTLTFKAVDWSGNEGFAETSFIIDSKEPRIRRTYPKNGEYVSTNFIIEYSEENLESITLHYKPGNPGAYTDVTRTDCPSGENQVENQVCVFTVNGLPQGELYYYFTVSDVATSVDSNEILVYVDTIAPVITNGISVQEFYPERKFQFDIHISEGVTLEYIDYSDTRPRYKKLCSKCSEYTKSKSFNEGFHDLTIRATDDAGNTDTIDMSFTVDSSDPRIKKTEPSSKKYSKGSFSVMYDEDNVQSVTLYYKSTNPGTYAQAPLTDCPSGKNQGCIIQLAELEGVDYAEYWYYFAVEDVLGRVDYSRETLVYVDTIAPEITKADFTLNGRRVNFDIKVSEKVELGYIDNLASRPTYRMLCSRCDSYTRSKYFSYGEHELTIIATDNAGNTDQETITFMIT